MTEQQRELTQGSKKDRAFNFRATLQKESEDVNYIYLKIFDGDCPLGRKDNRGITKFSQSIDQLREFDLVLISETEITNRHQFMDSAFLYKLRNESGKFLAVVRDSRKPEANFVKIKVDNMHEEYFRLKQLTLFDSDTKLHCYFMGSLMTVVREFRTIKNCEFFSTGPTILNPSLVLNNQLACNEPLTQKMRDFLAKN